MSNIEQLFMACQELLEIDHFRCTVLGLPREYCFAPAIMAIRNCLPGAVNNLRLGQERNVARDGLPKGWGE